MIRGYISCQVFLPQAHTHTHVEEHKEILGSDGYVQYFDWGGGIMKVRIFPNIKMYTLNMCNFCCINYRSIKLKKRTI